MNETELIALAISALRPHHAGDRLCGDVAAAVQSRAGSVFLGVSVDTPGWGLCAERSALAAMMTAGEYRFQRIVAVWRHPSDHTLYVLPPCGICCEFMRAIDHENLHAEILLGNSSTAQLKDLLPAHTWPAPLTDP